MSRIMTPSRPRSGLQDLASALGIAKSVFGIYQGVKESGQAEEDRQLAQQERERKASGVMTPGERNALLLSGKAESVPQGTEGALEVGIRAPGSKEQTTAYLKAPKPKFKQFLKTDEGYVGVGPGGNVTPLGIKPPKKELTPAQIAMAEERILRREERKQDQLDKKVTKFSQDLEKVGVPGAVNTINNLVEKIPPPGQDIPGIGRFEGSVTDFGREVGGTIGLLPGGQKQAMKGRELRQAASAVFNIELKNRSGAAVTDQELKRLKDEFGSGGFKTDAEFRAGLIAYVRRLKQVVKNQLSGASPEAVKEYMDRGGDDFLSSLDGALANLTGSPGQNQTQPQNPSDMNLQESIGAALDPNQNRLNQLLEEKRRRQGGQ